MAPLLSVRDLRTWFAEDQLTAKAVEATKLTAVAATHARVEADALPAAGTVERENRNKAKT